ncbi:hypothetical protein [Micromonospora sp. NPDC047730]|uniref:hypothetical protein n=1 Tax=Micromonospora sp. NPDC047730 TaxID=3364253 RepID=UPI003720C06E
MTNGTRAPRPVPSVGLPRRRVYLLGPSHGSDRDRARRFRPALDAIAAAGFEVVAPGYAPPSPVDADDLLSVVGDDLEALASADVVVTLPGSESLWEFTIAGTLGVPVIPVAAFVAELKSA